MIKVYNQQGLDAELKKHKAVLALFYSSGCPFCVGFVPTFNKKVADMNFESVIQVVLDDYDDPLWDDYDIPAVPTIIYFEDGKVSKRLDGQLGRGLSEEKLKTWIKDFKPT
jgi:thiol-disulfide isomerase/thioredoxin